MATVQYLAENSPSFLDRLVAIRGHRYQWGILSVPVYVGQGNASSALHEQMIHFSRPSVRDFRATLRTFSEMGPPSNPSDKPGQAYRLQCPGPPKAPFQSHATCARRLGTGRTRLQNLSAPDSRHNTSLLFSLSTVHQYDA